MSYTILNTLAWKRPLPVLFISTLFLLPAVGLRAEGDDLLAEPSIITRQNVPAPRKQQYQNWVQNFFETDEVWRFKDQKSFEEIIDSSQVDPLLKTELKELYRDKLTTDQTIKAIVHYKTNGEGGFVLVPLAIRRRVPKDLLEVIYTHQFETLNIKPPLYIEKNTESEVLQTLKALRFSETEREIARENTIFLDGKYLILITPFTWTEFPERLRQKVVDGFLARQPDKDGVTVDIKVNRRDDLAAIAQKHAGERDPRPIERYLRRVLGTSQSVVVPLEKIMPPFTRKMIDSYTDCHGPNCFNSGLNVNRGQRYKVESLSEESSFMREVYKQYRFVEPTENLNVGDLCVYRDASGSIVHVSSYIGEGLVFTKNGLNKFSPYIFQEVEKNEKIFFPDGKYQLTVFRIPGKGEEPVSSNGYFEGREPFYKDLLSQTSKPFEVTLGLKFEDPSHPSAILQKCSFDKLILPR